MKQNYAILIIITHKYIPFKLNVHEKFRVKGHRFMCYQLYLKFRKTKE